MSGTEVISRPSFQGSPNMSDQRKETYRHALSATSVRPGLDGTPYLYTLNLSCRQDMWSDLEPLFQQSIDSFDMLATTDRYIPPDKVCLFLTRDR